MKFGVDCDTVSLILFYSVSLTLNTQLEVCDFFKVDDLIGTVVVERLIKLLNVNLVCCMLQHSV